MIEKKRKEANKIPGVTLEKDRNIDKNFDDTLREFTDDS